MSLYEYISDFCAVRKQPVHCQQIQEIQICCSNDCSSKMRLPLSLVAVFALLASANASKLPNHRKWRRDVTQPIEEPSGSAQEGVESGKMLDEVAMKYSVEPCLSIKTSDDPVQEVLEKALDAPCKYYSDTFIDYCITNRWDL